MLNVFCIRPYGLNVGNELIGLALRQLLIDAFGASVNLISVPAVYGEEGDWVAGLGPQAVHQMNLYGHGVVVGGGNLYENGRLDVDLHALERLQPPLLLSSLSSGRIYDHRHRLTARTDAMPDAVIVALNRQASGSLVRDEATLAQLRQLGVTDALVGGCPTLFADELVPPDTGGPSQPDGALVAIRSPQLMNIPLADQARVPTEVRRIVEALEAQGLGPVRLVCNDKRDIAFAASLEGVEFVFPSDVPTYLDLLRSARLLVSFRLHAFIPSVCLGTPAVNISYDERSISLVRTVGLEEWDIDFVRDEDVVASVMDRVSRLDDLAVLCEGAQATWRALEQTTRTAIARFADEVTAYAAEGVLDEA
jgi:hypothetical protein